METQRWKERWAKRNESIHTKITTDENWNEAFTEITTTTTKKNDVDVDEERTHITKWSFFIRVTPYCIAYVCKLVYGFCLMHLLHHTNLYILRRFFRVAFSFFIFLYLDRTNFISNVHCIHASSALRTSHKLGLFILIHWILERRVEIWNATETHSFFMVEFQHKSCTTNFSSICTILFRAAERRYKIVVMWSDWSIPAGFKSSA